MKTLSEIKDEIAQEDDFSSWETLETFYDLANKYFDKIAERYAQEYYKSKAKDLLERAAVRAICMSTTELMKKSITETPLEK